MMEQHKGKGQLTDLESNSLFEVEYSIDFSLAIQARRGQPPVLRGHVNFILACDRSPIHLGIYVLLRLNGASKVNHLAWGVWYLVSEISEL
jgi:hypothetical protein